MADEIDLMRRKIRENIQFLINDNKLDEAINIIDEYLKLNLKDVEAYSMKAVAYIMNGNMRKAEEALKQGLIIDADNFDLNYNLGYLYEQEEEFNNAIKYYRKALKNCNNESTKSDVTSLVEKLLSEHDVEYMEDKMKLAFFVKQGMDSFLGEIINGFSDEYEVKKVIVTDLKQVDDGMQWADICWFEWCDELVSYASKHRLATGKKIICRIHGYEVYGDLIKTPNWKNIDNLIIVAPHIRRLFEENTKNLDKGNLRIHTVFCGINVDKYNLNIKKKGYNLGYLGYINYKKNIPLTLDIFKKLYDKDRRYKLYLAGAFQDTRTVEYLKYFIKEYNLEDNIIFDGWKNQQEKIEWFKKIDYMVISSIDEGLCFAAAEAMCSGIKPILHNCEGLKDHYEKKYIYNNIDEAIDMIISTEYDSKDYRKFIEDKYSITKEHVAIKNILASLEHNNKFDYSSYWNSRLDSKFDIEGVGYIGLGKRYNEYLYKSRFECLNVVINKMFKNSKINSVLEIGPGIGLFSDYFFGKEVDEYFAIDISEKSVQILSEKYKSFKFVQGDISNKINYPKEKKYNLVFGADVLLHLTDEEKFKNAVQNMCGVLDDNGYMIIFDAISRNPIKNTSPHVKIRDSEYLKRIAKENDMEIIADIPVYFFMSNPFDVDIDSTPTESAIAINIFNTILKLSSEQFFDKEDNRIMEYLYQLDKLCLINYEFGLSEKMIIMKKKKNKSNINLCINDIWEKKKIEKSINDFLANSEYVKKLYNNNDLVSIQQNINKLIYINYDINEVNERINLFNSYDVDDIDNYNFDHCKIIIGKKEIITDKYEIIEFILSNKEKQIIITGIWYDRENGNLIVPSYIEKSKNVNKVLEFIQYIIQQNIEYNNRGMAGFINDEKIANDIKNNQLAYSWERGIPATQFMPLIGYINVIERYKLTELFIKKSDIILEAASGFGYGAAFMSKKCDKVEALDLAKDNIEFGEKTYNFNNINWIVGDVTQLPYSDNYFDVYVSFETLEHLPLNLIEQYFLESIRVLKNDGKMIISTPNSMVRKNVHNPFHIKEYNFYEFDELLNKYFSEVEYYSIVNNRLIKGMNLAAYNMMAVCYK